MIAKCKNCIFWEQNTKYEHTLNEGYCKELIGSDRITVNLKLGWDGGYVDSIETQEDFCCSLYKSR